MAHPQLADVLPEMPDDWYPSPIIVQCKHRVGDRMIELAFVLNPEVAENPGAFNACMTTFRQAFWEAIHAKEMADGPSAS
jgi:hypothetical protein